jgi:hypothetical protein
MGYTAADATEAGPTPTPIDFASYASADFVQRMDGIERAAKASIFAIRIHPPIDGCPEFARAALQVCTDAPEPVSGKRVREPLQVASPDAM